MGKKERERGGGEVEMTGTDRRNFHSCTQIFICNISHVPLLASPYREYTRLEFWWWFIRHVGNACIGRNEPGIPRHSVKWLSRNVICQKPSGGNAETSGSHDFQRGEFARNSRNAATIGARLKLRETEKLDIRCLSSRFGGRAMNFLGGLTRRRVENKEERWTENVVWCMGL